MPRVLQIFERKRIGGWNWESRRFWIQIWRRGKRRRIPRYARKNWRDQKRATIVFGGNKSRRRPLVLVFGYDYFAVRARAAEVATPRLLSYEGLWGGGEEYAYEVLNFTDGVRNAQQIRDRVSVEYGPVPLEMVVEYLRALEKIGVVSE